MAAFDIDAPYQTNLAVATTYQMTDLDIGIMATATGAYTITLPPLAGVPKGHLVVIGKDATAFVVTVAGSGTDKINNVASGTVTLAASAVHSATLISAGSTWILVGVA